MKVRPWLVWLVWTCACTAEHAAPDATLADSGVVSRPSPSTTDPKPQDDPRDPGMTPGKPPPGSQNDEDAGERGGPDDMKPAPGNDKPMRGDRAPADKPMRGDKAPADKPKPPREGMPPGTGKAPMPPPHSDGGPPMPGDHMPDDPLEPRDGGPHAEP